jgi:hypothetical protein
MWFLVTVVKGSKYFESDSQIDNRILISDTTDMVVAGYATGTGGYRFEMRKGNEAFVLEEMGKGLDKAGMVQRFLALADRLGALNPAGLAPAA